MIKTKIKRIAQVILSTLLIVALNFSTFFLPVSAADIPEPFLRDLYDNGVYYYNPCGGSSSGSSSSSNGYIGHLDPSLILSAKNADKQNSDFGNAGSWSDTDTASMKKLLETYGDLAYQVGRTVNVPYVGVLVQLRYEDQKLSAGKIISGVSVALLALLLGAAEISTHSEMVSLAMLTVLLMVTMIKPSVLPTQRNSSKNSVLRGSKVILMAPDIAVLMP